MIRLEAASPVSQRRYDFTQKRIVNSQVQKFVRVRYHIDVRTPVPTPKRKSSLWGALAALFQRAA